MNSEACLLGDNSVVQWYQSLLTDGVIYADDKQAEAVRLLQKMTDAIITPNEHKGFFRKIKSRWSPANNITNDDSGLYFYGGVGRGKSFLMDGFYLQIPLEKKLRVHFHRFMLHFHDDMKKQEGQQDPLIKVADSIADRFSLICFDEFHVSDIADAMILGRLLDRLLERGVRFVMTSNYAPDGLYPNGLARERFLPTIALLNKYLRVFALDSENDYRLRHYLQRGQVFFYPLNENSTQAMRSLFEDLACGLSLSPQVKVGGGRLLPALARAPDIVWFSFDKLCGGAYSPADYLTLTDRFGTVMLSQIPVLGDNDMSEATRRFTWLVDVLYDNRIKFIAAAEKPPEQLYKNGAEGEATRTLSRLIEMQSKSYWEAGSAATV